MLLNQMEVGLVNICKLAQMLNYGLIPYTHCSKSPLVDSCQDCLENLAAFFLQCDHSPALVLLLGKLSNFFCVNSSSTSVCHSACVSHIYL